MEMKSLIFAICGYLILSGNIPRVSTGRNQRSETENSAERLRELVRRMRDYIDSVSEELKSYEEQLAQAATSSESGPKDPHGMVIVPDDDEKTTTPVAETSSTETSQPEQCNCDCQSTKQPEEDATPATTTEAVDNDNVQHILKTIRELLHEAEGE